MSLERKSYLLSFSLIELAQCVDCCWLQWARQTWSRDTEKLTMTLMNYRIITPSCFSDCSKSGKSWKRREKKKLMKNDFGCLERVIQQQGSSTVSYLCELLVLSRCNWIQQQQQEDHLLLWFRVIPRSIHFVLHAYLQKQHAGRERETHPENCWFEKWLRFLDFLSSLTARRCAMCLLPVSNMIAYVCVCVCVCFPGLGDRYDVFVCLWSWTNCLYLYQTGRQMMACMSDRSWEVIERSSRRSHVKLEGKSGFTCHCLLLLLLQGLSVRNSK